MLNNYSVPENNELKCSGMAMPRGVTNCCQISYTPTEILFEINEITRFSKSKIKKFGMETSKIS